MPVSTALVLGGGGARAAYQIGVLKALVQFYPRNHNVPFDIICGTSAGAINAISIATHASCFHLAIKKLDWVWRHFETHKGLQDDKVNTDAGSLLDNQPLRELLNNLIDFKRIDRNIGNDALKAISIDSSCYNNSRSYTFYQGNEHIDDWQRARRVGIRSLLNTEHLLASSAIPMVFPSIKLNQAYYGDGSVHQLSPLSSPIHLGANKIFVINLDSPHKHFPIEFEYHPKTATIAGHLLDTIFSDTLNSDLERLQRVNNTLSMISPQDRETLNLRHIDTLVMKPSQDLSRIAERFYDDMPFAIKTLLKLFGINRQSDSSIVSYLLFEKSYTTTLIDLGYQDAMDRIDEIKQFFDIQTKV